MAEKRNMQSTNGRFLLGLSSDGDNTETTTKAVLALHYLLHTSLLCTALCAALLPSPRRESRYKIHECLSSKEYYHEEGIKFKNWDNIISGYDSYFGNCPRKPGQLVTLLESRITKQSDFKSTIQNLHIRL
jgi:hypothetical protein